MIASGSHARAGADGRCRDHSSVFARGSVGAVACPHDPFDPATLFLADAFLPPRWAEGGDARFLLGTDDQGRCLLSSILLGMRISLLVGIASVLVSAVIGTVLGVSAGYIGGIYETLVMRAADVQLTIPGILVALTLSGIARTALPRELVEAAAIWVLILAIGISGWPHYARVTRGVALVEKSKDYVAAARVIGVHPLRIMFKHLLPNVIGPVWFSQPSDLRLRSSRSRRFRS